MANTKKRDPQRAGAYTEWAVGTTQDELRKVKDPTPGQRSKRRKLNGDANIIGGGTEGGPGGAAATARRDAKDPWISNGSGSVRASQSGLSAEERAAISPLNSPKRRKARQAASGVFSPNRYQPGAR